MSFLRRWLQGPEVALLHQFHRPPYGGGNQFLHALRGELRRRGLDVSGHRIGPRTRACLFNSYNFDPDWLRPLRGSPCRKVHRVDGPIGLYRGADASLDHRIAAVNQEFADVTVFQSHYSQEAHRELGIEVRAPVVIRNAVDPRLFHPAGRIEWNRNRKVRLISTSWSDNPNKGGATYKWIEDHLDWERYEYTFVGRSSIPFERIHMLRPLSSARLAGVLRQHDIYVAGSLHDPCSNALLEALACGLPAVFARSGGHPEIVGDAGVGFDRPEAVPELLAQLVREYETRQAAIAVPPLSQVADRYLQVMGLQQPGP